MEDRIVLSLVAVSTGATKINPSSSFAQTTPSVAMDSNGDSVVAWVQAANINQYDIDVQVYNPAGVAQLSTPVTVNNTTSLNYRPTVAMDSAGDFVVAWHAYNTSYVDTVYARRYTLDKPLHGSYSVTPQGSQFQVSPDGAAGSLAKVAMDSEGDFVIAWQGYDSDHHGIFAQQFNASGTPQGNTFRVNNLEADSQVAPAIAMDSAGDFAIAWQDGGPLNGNPGQTAGIYSQRYTYNAGSGGPTVHGVNTAISTAAGAANPSVAMEPTGQSVIAWQYTQKVNSQNDDFTGVEAQRFDASGNALTGVVVLSTPEDYDQGDASVAIDSEGDFVVAWDSYGVGGTESPTATILAQRVNSGGTLIGPTQFTPSTQGGDNQRLPSVANDPYGDTTIVWESKPSTTSDSGNAYTRPYDHVNDAPTINTPSNVTIDQNAGQQTVNLTGITAGGGETQMLTVTASSKNSALVSPSVTYTSPSSTGNLTFTPAANSTGTATITLTVTDDGGTLHGGIDATIVQFTVTVNSVPPTINTPSNVTIDENAGQQTVNLTGITTGGGGTQTLTVTASSNNTSLINNPTVTYTSPNSTGTLHFTPTANQYGTATLTVTVSDNIGTTSVHFTVTVNQVAATVTAVSADWGTVGTIALQTAADGLRLQPAGLNPNLPWYDLPWYGINKLQITLSQPETLSPSDVSVTGIAVSGYTVMISGSGTNYTIKLNPAITTADRVTVTIANAGIATFTRRLDVLPGDVNDDGVVNGQDIVQIRNDFAAFGVAYNVLDDINGDGVVDVGDTNLAARFIGKKLPPVPIG